MSLTASDDDNERQTDVPVPSGEDAIQDKLALEEVLKALPQKDQTLIRLRYFKGFKNVSKRDENSYYCPFSAK